MIRRAPIWVLAVYAFVADLIVLFVVLPFQRYAVVTAQSDASTPSTVLALLACDVMMLVYVLSGMAANGAVIRFCLLRASWRVNMKR